MTDFDFNPFDPDTRRHPAPIYAQARREHPVYRHPGLPIVSVFRHVDVQAILREPATWSNNFRPPPGVDPDRLPRSMLGQDPPDHTRLRSLVSQAFTPRMIRRLEPRLHEIADELMTAALAQGDVDFVQAMTYPLPVIVIAEMIGVPPAERPQFKAWSDVAVAGLGTGLFAPPDMARLEQLQAVLRDMGAYFSALAEERRRAPREDLLTGLVQAEVEGSKLTHAEMITMLVLLLVAGNETTTTLIGNAVLELLDHPDALAQVRADPTLLPGAIDEVLRFASPVQLDPRRATRRVELRGEVIEPDQIVVSWLGSANRDEDVFADPERFDITRTDSRHLAFGLGPHYCLGANLARLEAQTAIGALLRRTRSFGRTTSGRCRSTEPGVPRRDVVAAPTDDGVTTDWRMIAQSVVTPRIPFERERLALRAASYSSREAAAPAGGREMAHCRARRQPRILREPVRRRSSVWASVDMRMPPPAAVSRIRYFGAVGALGSHAVHSTPSPLPPRPASRCARTRPSSPSSPPSCSRPGLFSSVHITLPCGPRSKWSNTKGISSRGRRRA